MPESDAMNDSASCLAPTAEPASLSADEARQWMFSAIAAVSGQEMVPLRSALGRVLASALIAPYDVPAYDNSAMDGYAVRGESLGGSQPVVLSVVGAAFAGKPFSGFVGPGQAVRIMTGAVLPAGADTVLLQEVVQVDGKTVIVPPGQRAGQNIRRAGEDLARGAVALAAGKRIGPAELGLMASLGLAEVAVRRRLRVAILATGDELAAVGAPLSPGELYDSNRYTLHGLLSRLGAEVIDIGSVADEPVALADKLREAATMADAIITTGGVSVGEADHVRPVLAGLGEIHFWNLNIRPGRPMAFGRIGQAWLFGLPGNPVAVMVNYVQFVLDALLRLSGVDPLPPRPLLSVVSAGPIRKQPGARAYLRGVVSLVDGCWLVSTSSPRGAGILRSMSEANCLIVLPEACAGVEAGECVQVQMFDGLF